MKKIKPRYVVAAVLLALAAVGVVQIDPETILALIEGVSP